MSGRTDPAAEPILDADSSLAARWEAAFRERFDEPIERATEITRQTLAWFPIRVWRHFLQHNGFLLAAGISYQALFTIFAVIYVAFAAVGLWLGGSEEAIDWLIDLINSYIPNLISSEGLVSPSQVTQIAQDSSSVLLTTGGIAIVVAVWTAIGFITYTRRAVRDTFGLPFDRRSYVLLKARDLLAALVFGAALVLGSVATNVATWAVEYVLPLFGIAAQSFWTDLTTRTATFIFAFLVNAAALAALFKFLTGTSLRWRRVWVGSMLGGAAIVALQAGVAVLFRYTPTNPLLATFAIFIGFLLWFRLNGIVILVAGAWVAVDTADRDLPLVEESDDDRRRREYDALVTAARIEVREARRALAEAPWWRRPLARRTVHDAESHLRELEASPPPPRKARFLD